MPRTTTRSLPKAPAYLDIQLQAQALSETNDCAVRALAFAADITYVQAHDLLKAKGRKDRCGTPLHFTLGCLRELGYTVRTMEQTEMTSRYPGKHSQKRVVTSNQPDRFPSAWRDGKTYLLVTDNHILCIKNGVNLDWSKGRVLLGKLLYEVTKA